MLWTNAKLVGSLDKALAASQFTQQNHDDLENFVFGKEYNNDGTSSYIKELTKKIEYLNKKNEELSKKFQIMEAEQVLLLKRSQALEITLTIQYVYHHHQRLS